MDSEREPEWDVWDGSVPWTADVYGVRHRGDGHGKQRKGKGIVKWGGMGWDGVPGWGASEREPEWDV